MAPGVVWSLLGEMLSEWYEDRAPRLGTARRSPQRASPLVSAPDTRELAEQFTRNLLRLPRESILSTWKPDPELDITPILGQVKAPTLVLHGAEDRRVSVAAAHHLARHIPDARLYLFEGRGHLPIFTATAEFCEVLQRFVRRTGHEGG